MIYFERGSAEEKLSSDDLRTGLHTALDALGERKKVIAVPPDYTRLPSQAGVLTEAAYQYCGDKLTDVLPALGTHHRARCQKVARQLRRTRRRLCAIQPFQRLAHPRVQLYPLGKRQSRQKRLADLPLPAG